MKCSLGISHFLEAISSLSHSFVFHYFFALITEEGFLISSCYSLELCIQMFISFLFSFAFSLLFFSQLFVRPPQIAILLFCISFPWGWSWFLSPIQWHKSPSIALQALCQWDLILWIYFSLLLYSHKGFDSYLTIYLVSNKYLSYLVFWDEVYLFISLKTKGNITKAVIRRKQTNKKNWKFKI